MWHRFLLCIFVAVAYASTNSAWRDNKAYVYHVRGRSLASLHEVNNEYTGILLKAKLTITKRSDDALLARITKPTYAIIHKGLPDGWNTFIPDSEVTYKPLDLSEKPFEIEVANGVVHNIKVNKEVSNWEVNMIKSIVSQLQLNTNAENAIPSPVNTLPEYNTNTANFKVMEETVTGNTETLYDIHLLPEYVLQGKPWLVPKLDLKGDGQMIELIKNKNFSNSQDIPSYHFGFFNMAYMKPSSNKMGDFLTRSSISRAVITGNLNRYTIQNSHTVHKIMAKPTLANIQRGSIISMLNITLADVKQNTEKTEVTNSISVGGLVYTFNHPSNREAHSKIYQTLEETYSSEENHQEQGRFRRHTEQFNKFSSLFSLKRNQRQASPNLSTAPHAPLLPFTIGYKGVSVKHDKSFNSVKEIKELCREISHDLDKEQEKVLHEDSLTKFTMVASLTRIMDANKLNEVANELYTEEKSGRKYTAWVAFRDALAESGTGPALLTINDLILSKKVKDTEAVDIISTMALSVREPTLEYIQSFYSWLNNPVVKEQHQLNNAVLLSLTDLVRKVYISKKESHNKYPVHSFGSFRTKEGKAFVQNTLIPSLSQQLEKAISDADVHRILTVIRALGNIGDKQILSAFEPYLEGKKQCSQFQRWAMVVSLDKLVKVDPVRARSVLYKLYQNVGEIPEIRATAVYQIIRTGPSSDILQRMAEFTHIDTSKIVNAAVKSSIENAANLKENEFRIIRDSARSALPLLIKDEFEPKQTYNHLRNFVIEQMRVSYKQTLQLISDINSAAPKYVKYAFRSRNGGLRQQWTIIQGLVSSVDELVNSLKNQIGAFKEQQPNVHQDKWSSENIARLLNMKSDEREQLEGFLNVELGPLRRFFTFDNKTIEHLPEVIHHMEEVMKNENSVNYMKFVNRDEIALAYPTELGLPFLYTYDKPSLVYLRGHVKGSAKPSVSNGKVLQFPELISAEGQIHTTISTKVSGRISFITPFDHQQYVAGYEKLYQLNIPLRGNLEVDLKNNQIKAEIMPIDSNRKANMMHYSSWPYTSRHNIMQVRGYSHENKVITKKNQQRTFDHVYGKETIGVAFRAKGFHESDVGFSWLDMIHKISKGECVLKTIQNQIQNMQFDLSYDPSLSSSNKLSIHLGQRRKYKSEGDDDKHDLSHLYKTPSQSNARQEDFLNKAGSNIHNAEINSYDAAFTFEGKDSFKYTFTAAVAKSNVDPTSRILFYYKRHANSQITKNYQVAVSAKIENQNSVELDVNDAIKHEPYSKSQVYIAFGHEYDSSSKVKAEIHRSRSEQIKKLLMEDPLYHMCKKQMDKGNHQLPACANMTSRFNEKDVLRIKLEHHNIDPKASELIKTVYNVVRMNYYPLLEVSQEEKTKVDECNYEVRFNPSRNSFNVSMRVLNERVKMSDVPVVFKCQEAIKPSCVVDQTMVNTFNNESYPLKLDKSWTVIFQYVPPVARQHERLSVEHQLKKQHENYVVLVRGLEKSQKEVKITLRTPETQESIDITMKPSNGHSGEQPRGRVSVNEKEIKFNHKQGHDIKKGLVEIYSLPNGEVKVWIRNTLSLVYDGVRVKLTPITGKFGNALRGICGQFSENKANDWLAPENCVARNSEDLVSSYRVEEGKQRQHNLQQCSKVEILYANVISDNDVGRDLQNSGQMNACTVYKTHYVEQNDEVCFTRQKYPHCKCRQQGTVTKNVSVHCIKKSQVSNMYVQRINQGIVESSFEDKPESKTIDIELPKTCIV